MTCLEIISLIFIALVCVKLIVVTINPAAWTSVVSSVYSNTVVIKVVGILAAGVILRCLLRELTIVQIFASMTLMMALMMVQFACFGKEITEVSQKFLNNKDLLKKAGLSIVIWVGLMLWVLYTILI